MSLMSSIGSAGSESLASGELVLETLSLETLGLAVSAPHAWEPFSFSLLFTLNSSQVGLLGAEANLAMGGGHG